MQNYFSRKRENAFFSQYQVGGGHKMLMQEGVKLNFQFLCKNM